MPTRTTRNLEYIEMQVGALEALVGLGCDAKVRDSVASTPMHVAAGEGHIEAILKLVDLVRFFAGSCISFVP